MLLHNWIHAFNYDAVCQPSTDGYNTAMKVPSLVQRIVCVSILAVVSACSAFGEDVGEITADSFTLASCPDGKPFPIILDYVEYDDCNDILYLRLQEEGTPIGESDGMVIYFPSLKQLKQDLKDGPVIRTVVNNGVRSGITINHSCSDANVGLEAVDGEITIRKLTLKNGGIIRLDGWFEIIDTRTGETVIPTLTLTIDTADSYSWPTQTFPLCD
jgi:hypothetical protein